MDEEKQDNNSRNLEKDGPSPWDDNQAAEVSSESPEDKTYTLDEDLEDSLQGPLFADEEVEDRLWQARTGLDHDGLCGAIESIIFMSERPIPLVKIRQLIDKDIPLKAIHQSILRLQDLYEKPWHGLRLQEVAQGYQFRTKVTYSKYIQKMYGTTTLALSPTALEVLAIVAYKQPISRTEIDRVRGVDSSHILRGLMDKKLIKVVGRSDDLGRPTLYGTTHEFLEVFNLGSIEELPPEHELESFTKNDQIGQIKDIKEIVSGTGRPNFGVEDIEELEALDIGLREISADTEFTRTLKQEEKKRFIENEVGKSAFDLLEEFIARKAIILENQEAAQSVLWEEKPEGAKVLYLQDLDQYFERPIGAFPQIFHHTGNWNSELESEKGEGRSGIGAFLDAFGSHRGELVKELVKDLVKDKEEEKEEEFLAEESLAHKISFLDQLTESISEEAQELDLDLNFLHEKEPRDEELPPSSSSNDLDD